MKVICTGNALSDRLLTPIHRDYFEARFARGKPPHWNAEPGRTYTVYGIHISRGYPFYFVERESRYKPDWGFIPSICFETVDARLSSLWRYNTRIFADHRGVEIFTTLIGIDEWFGGQGFLEYLVDSRSPEVEIMARAAAFMDAE